MIILMLAILVVCYMLLAGVVVYGNLKRTANVLFGAILLCFAVWSLGMVVFIGGTDEVFVRAGAALFYLAATCFAPLLLVFALHYPRKKHVDWRWFVVLASTTAMLVVLIVFYPRLIIDSLAIAPGGERIVGVNRAGYLVFSVPFVAYFFAALGVDVTRRLEETTRSKQQQLYYMVGIVATSIPGFAVDLVLPFFGNYQWIWIGPLVSTVFLGVTLYSMSRFRLLRVKSFLVQAVTYTCLILTLAVLYGIIFFSLSTILWPQADSPSTDSFVLNVSLALVAAFAFQPLKRFFDSRAERIFYRRNYDTQQVVDSLTKLATRSTDADTLLTQYLSAFSDIFHPKFAAIVFKDPKRKTYITGRRAAEWLSYKSVAAIKKEPLVYSHHIATIITLHASTQDIGYLVIGEGKDDREYREKDVALFGVLANELSIALLNIFRLEEIRRFAKTLENEVNDATAKLRQSNEQLKFLDATKDEFVSMASHQLRTPLTSVKGYLSMVLDGDAGKITDKQRQLLQEAFISSERMVHLIGDFLNVSRLQTGKFVIDKTQVDLVQIVAEEVANVGQVASAHKVEVKYRPPARFPLLYLDENKIRQVIMNLIDNAIYYSPDANSVRVRLSIEDGDAVLRVIDKGMGVPKEAQKRLFTKFFRADNARNQRPDGTGIGLYLAKKVVGGHGGRLVFESELNKGSTFGFRLPINKLKNPPSAE